MEEEAIQKISSYINEASQLGLFHVLVDFKDNPSWHNDRANQKIIESQLREAGFSAKYRVPKGHRALLRVEWGKNIYNQRFTKSEIVGTSSGADEFRDTTLCQRAVHSAVAPKFVSFGSKFSDFNPESVMTSAEESLLKAKVRVIKSQIASTSARPSGLAERIKHEGSMLQLSRMSDSIQTEAVERALGPLEHKVEQDELSAPLDDLLADTRTVERGVTDEAFELLRDLASPSEVLAHIDPKAALQEDRFQAGAASLSKLSENEKREEADDFEAALADLMEVGAGALQEVNAATSTTTAEDDSFSAVKQKAQQVAAEQQRRQEEEEEEQKVAAQREADREASRRDAEAAQRKADEEAAAPATATAAVEIVQEESLSDSKLEEAKREAQAAVDAMIAGDKAGQETTEEPASKKEERATAMLFSPRDESAVDDAAAVDFKSKFAMFEQQSSPADKAAQAKKDKAAAEKKAKIAAHAKRAAEEKAAAQAKKDVTAKREAEEKAAAQAKKEAKKAAAAKREAEEKAAAQAKKEAKKAAAAKRAAEEQAAQDAKAAKKAAARQRDAEEKAAAAAKKEAKAKREAEEKASAAAKKEAEEKAAAAAKKAKGAKKDAKAGKFMDQFSQYSAFVQETSTRFKSQDFGTSSVEIAAFGGVLAQEEEATVKMSQQFRDKLSELWKDAQHEEELKVSAMSMSDVDEIKSTLDAVLRERRAAWELAVKNAPRVCPECKRTFKSVQALSDHQKGTGHSGGRQDIVKSADIFLPTQLGESEDASVPEEKQEVEEQKQKEPVSCKNCKKTFGDEEAAEHHQIDAHEPHCCLVCGKKAKSAQALASHEHDAGHHVCGVCYATFPDAKATHRHKEDSGHHLYHCGQCSDVFKSPWRLVEHEGSSGHKRSAKGGAKKSGKPTCSVCSKSFKSGEGLAAHQKDTGHQDKSADKAKAQEAPVVDAAAKAPVKVGSKYPCGGCKKKFKSTEGLKDHRASTGHAAAK